MREQSFSPPPSPMETEATPQTPTKYTLSPGDEGKYCVVHALQMFPEVNFLKIIHFYQNPL